MARTEKKKDVVIVGLGWTGAIAVSPRNRNGTSRRCGIGDTLSLEGELCSLAPARSRMPRGPADHDRLSPSAGTMPAGPRLRNFTATIMRT